MTSAETQQTRTLAILVKRFPRLSETFILNEIIELARQGIPLKIFALLDPREGRAHPAAEALRPEVSYLRGSEHPGDWLHMIPEIVSTLRNHPAGVWRGIRFALGRRTAATWKHLAEALVMARRIEREGVTHLHASFAHSPAAVVYLVHLVTGISFSFTAHAKDLYTTPASYIRARGNAASFVVTCTEANGSFIRESIGIDPARVRVLHHGVDMTPFDALVSDPVPGRILSVGRLVPKKGYNDLLRALAELASRSVKFECVIVGSGPLREQLETCARDLGLTERVTFRGSLTHEDVVREYETASIFALSPVMLEDGDRDGIPNVILEAMAAGAPVVSTAISGIPEVVSDGVNGILVPAGDPTALANALEHLLSDSSARQRLGEAARAWVREHRTLAQCVTPLATLFREHLKP